ncbi:MAG: Gfo/Idh/MocA family oxidoreductase [Pseudobutyrivibrio sp.]|nr:Gfo/Idh/MocA family oxidoreductase [Pseudobutyrivibrio sp.]
MKKVITYGTFDLFHEGHYKLLQRAKALGDYLIVGVTTESYDRQRGKLNVVDDLLTRVENVRKSGFADEIIIEESYGQKVSDIQKYDIDIFTVGSDWVGKFDYLREYCEVVYLERTKDVSSTMLRNEAFSIKRIGIIGNGRIAGRFVSEAVGVSGVNIQGVYNPHTESAATFAENFDINCFKTEEELFENIDIAYIACPHQYHYEYIKKSIEYGKHVISEKPLVLKEAQARELFDLAKEKQVVVIEGIKTAYCPGFTKLIDVARSGIIGNIKYVDACFTKLEKTDSRELTDLQYGGSFIELGSYCLLPIIKLLGIEYEDISFDSIRGENGLDLFTKCSMKFPRGLATATCGLGVKSEGRLLIAGTLGYIVVDAPWWKTTYFEVHFENAEHVEKYSESYLGDGLRYEIADTLNRINGNSTSEFKLTRKESITMASVMEKFLIHENRGV